MENGRKFRLFLLGDQEEAHLHTLLDDYCWLGAIHPSWICIPDLCLFPFFTVLSQDTEVSPS